MGNKKFWLPVMAFTMLAASCQTGGDKLKSGIQVENMDTTVAPGADFYRYACGTWIKNHPLTAEYARYGTFDALIENNQKQLRELIEEIASGQHQQGTLQQKIASMFNCVMDSTRQNELGMTPIAGQLKEIYAAPDKKALFDIVARNYTAGVPTLFGFYMLAFLVGRWVGTALMVKFSPQRMLMFYSLMLIAHCVVISVFGGYVGLYAMLAVSFFMSIIYPTQFSLALQGLGGQTKSGSAFLVMAIVGNACLPQFTAYVMHVNEHIYHIAYIVPMVCFAFCAYYGWRGFRVKS